MAMTATNQSHESAERDEFNLDSTRLAIESACEMTGRPIRTVDLIRMGTNAVFRLNDDVIARVARSATKIDEAVKQVAVARWLKSEGYPATRALDIAQPVVACRHVVTFWESVSVGVEYASIAEVASLIKRLHELATPRGLDLPLLQPFGSDCDDLPSFPGLTAADSDFLRGRYEWARAEFTRLPFILPSGVVHGDANVGNVLRSDVGMSVLIDLDGFATGPREWDLIQTALFYDRFGWHSEQEYQTFVDVYGFDIMQWEGYSALADMRETAMTAWMSRKAEASTQAGAEAAKRIEAMRTGGSRADWAAY